MTTTSHAPTPPPPGLPDAAGTDWRAFAAAAVTVVLWASAFVVIRALSGVYSASALAFGRVAVGGLVLGLLVHRARPPLPRGRTLGFVVAYGTLWFAAYSVVLNRASHHLDPGTAALLVNVAPLLVAVLAGILLREGFPAMLLSGIVVAFIGVALISAGGSGVPSSASSLGILLGLLAALLYALSVLFQKVVLREVDGLTATFLGCVTAAVILTPALPTFVRETAEASPTSLAAVVYLGVFPTAIGFSTWAYALARGSAGRVTATTLIVPAVAAGLAWLLLGELPTTLGMVGGLLCLIGVAMSRRTTRATTRASERRT